MYSQEKSLEKNLFETDFQLEIKTVLIYFFIEGAISKYFDYPVKYKYHTLRNEKEFKLPILLDSFYEVTFNPKTQKKITDIKLFDCYFRELGNNEIKFSGEAIICNKDFLTEN